MKICHVINNLGNGGAERTVIELSRVQREAGQQVRIVTLTASPRGSLPALAAREWGLDVVSLGKRRVDPRQLWHVRTATREADIVHAHLFPAFYLTGTLSRRRAQLVTEHSPTNRRREIKWTRLVEAIAYGRNDVCVGVSDGVQESLQQYLAALGVAVPCVTVENGISLDSYATGRPAPRGDKSLRIITVGTLDERKNVSEAIRAVAGVDGVTLTVVGDGPLRSALEEQVRLSSQVDQVQFLGTRSDVPDLLAKHHCLLSTSRYEGFGLVTVEAMAAHVVVLAPDIPGVGQVVQDGISGILHQAHDLESLRKQIELMRDDEARRLRLALAAHERSRSFSIERTAAEYLQLYKSILERVPDPRAEGHTHDRPTARAQRSTWLGRLR